MRWRYEQCRRGHLSIFKPRGATICGRWRIFFRCGEHFSDRRPLVPLPKISYKNARVENELVCIVDHLLGGVGCGTGFVVCNNVIDLLPDNLNGVGGGVCLAEALFVGKPVCVCNHGVCLIQVGNKIQRARSSVTSVRPVFDTDKVVINGAHNLFPEGAVHVMKHV